MTGAEILHSIAADETMAGLDLTGIDLSGTDPTGGRFEDCTFPEGDASLHIRRGGLTISADVVPASGMGV